MAMKGRLVFISRNYKGTRHGGAKARVDIELLLEKRGAVNLGLKRTFHGSKVIDFLRNLAGILKYMATVRPGDTLFLQYPQKKYYPLVCRWARKRGAGTMTLIHDLGSFRRHKLTPGHETELLSLTDAAIAANRHTVRWLREQGLEIPLAEQKAWDFLDETPPAASDLSMPMASVMFVGHLSERKNGFLYRLPQALKVDLYGLGAPATPPSNVTLHGFATPSEVIASGRGRFGLIWYGPEISNERTGYIGEYIGYCNPHKLALYMLAGRPVIVGSDSAAADFVREHGVGIVVDTLEDLDRTLKGITESEYASMSRAALSVAAKMKRGGFLDDALRQLADKGKFVNFARPNIGADPS